MNRRHFLQALGLGTGALSLSSIGYGSSITPRRFIVFYTQHGTSYSGWNMRPGEYSETQRWQASLSSMESSKALQPLSPYFSQSLIIDGLGLVSAEVDQSGLQHEKGQVHSLTGNNIKLLSGIPFGTSASLDQCIASAVADSTQIPSLELCVGDAMSVSYNQNAQILPMEHNPVSLYRRLFGQFGQSQSSGTPILGQQSKLLERASTRFNRLSHRLSGTDRQKIETHRDLMHDLSIRIEGMDARRQSCEIPAMPDYTGDFEQDYDAFVALITAAFSGDLTRVASINLGTLPTSLVTGLPGDIHDEYAHEVMTSPIAKEVMTEYTRIHALQLRRLLDALSTVTDPHGDGSQTLLDNTIVLWVGELGDGAHGFDRWPAVVIGGGGFSSLNLGQYIHYPRTTPVDCWAADTGTRPYMGHPHQPLLTTLLRQYDPTAASMGVTEVLGRDGSIIDCSGILSELLQ